MSNSVKKAETSVDKNLIVCMSDSLRLARKCLTNYLPSENKTINLIKAYFMHQVRNIFACVVNI